MSTADRIAGIVIGLRPVHDDLALPDTCDIERETETRDSRGNIVRTWGAHLENIRCALDVAGQMGREYVVGSVESTEATYIITVPYDTDVTDNDRVVIGDRRFNVITARQGEGYEIARTLECREVFN